VIAGDEYEEGTDNKCLRIWALDDIEDPTQPIAVGYVDPRYPAVATESTKTMDSPYITRVNGNILLHFSKDIGDEAICSARISNLSPSGFDISFHHSNPVLTPQVAWEGSKTHSLSTVAYNGNWHGYYDGNENNTYKIGLAIQEVA
jgi:hypothetical protein